MGKTLHVPLGRLYYNKNDYIHYYKLTCDVWEGIECVVTPGVVITLIIRHFLYSPSGFHPDPYEVFFSQIKNRPNIHTVGSSPLYSIII